VTAMQGATAFEGYAQLCCVVRTGLALANTSATAATVQLELTNLDGSPTGFVRTIDLPPLGQRSAFLNELFLTGSQAVEGLLRITASSPIAVTSLRLRTNERGDVLVAATTPVEERSSAPDPLFVLPHFVVGGGYEMQFVLTNTRPGMTLSGSVFFFDQTGQPLALLLR